jgi:hypothetical protein
LAPRRTAAAGLKPSSFEGETRAGRPGLVERRGPYPAAWVIRAPFASPGHPEAPRDAAVPAAGRKCLTLSLRPPPEARLSATPPPTAGARRLTARPRSSRAPTKAGPGASGASGGARARLLGTGGGNTA